MIPRGDDRGGRGRFPDLRIRRARLAIGRSGALPVDRAGGVRPLGWRAHASEACPQRTPPARALELQINLDHADWTPAACLEPAERAAPGQFPTVAGD